MAKFFFSYFSVKPGNFWLLILKPHKTRTKRWCFALVGGTEKYIKHETPAWFSDQTQHPWLHLQSPTQTGQNSSSSELRLVSRLLWRKKAKAVLQKTSPYLLSTKGELVTSSCWFSRGGAHGSAGRGEDHLEKQCILGRAPIYPHPLSGGEWQRRWESAVSSRHAGASSPDCLHQQANKGCEWCWPAISVSID